jgi:hypothetical protein
LRSRLRGHGGRSLGRAAWGGLLELTAKAGAGALAYAIAVYVLDAAGARTQAERLLSVRRQRLA